MSLNITLVLRTIPESWCRIGWIRILTEIGFPLAEIEEYVEREESGVVVPKTMEKLRRTERNNLLEFKKEIPVQWRRERRVEYVDDQVAGLKMFRRRAEAINCPFWFKSIIWELLGGDKWLRLEKRLKRNDEQGNGITDDMISTAREYPMTELIKADKNGMAHSPFREDKHPSFSIKSNFYYDYATGENGDTIDLFVRLNGVSFIDAVKFLSRGGGNGKI